VYPNSKAADFAAEFSIPEQAHNVVLDAGEPNRFAQHGDQVGLRAAGSKFVDYVNMKHD
jgi:hypothetical protein